MNSALDRFEESLVRASRTMHRQQHAAGAHAGLGRAEAPGTTTARRTSRAAALLRRRGWRVAAGALLACALAAAGASVLGPHGNPREITQVQCGERGSSANVTGEPVRDCATLWPSLYHRPAPPLVAWVYETGGVVVVTPASHPPAGDGWRRLPKGWTADSTVLQLRTQLEDITTGIEARACWSAPAASARAASILDADRLSSWRVRVRSERADGPHPNCLEVSAITDALAHSVLLVERPMQEPAGWSPTFPSPSDRRIAPVEARLNGLLSGRGRCASVAQAAALWRSSARADGIADASYVLFKQANAHHILARCARVFVITPGGGGPADVYAADLP